MASFSFGRKDDAEGGSPSDAGAATDSGASPGVVVPAKRKLSSSDLSRRRFPPLHGFADVETAPGIAPSIFMRNPSSLGTLPTAGFSGAGPQLSDFEDPTVVFAEVREAFGAIEDGCQMTPEQKLHLCDIIDDAESGYAMAVHLYKAELKRLKQEVEQASQLLQDVHSKLLQLNLVLPAVEKHSSEAYKMTAKHLTRG